MLIDPSYFNGEINIPNVDQDSVLQNINWFINKYEPEFLQKVFGYSFYKTFIAGISTTLPNFPAQRWQNLIYGAEYNSLSSGKLEKWKGLLLTQIPVYQFGSGYIYKQPYWVQADVTPSGFIAGINTATFPDWIGWEPIIERKGQGTLTEGVDYSFDTDTGLLTLLKAGDTFQHLEYFYISFQLRPENQQEIDSSIKQSLIANYVYYWYLRNSDTNTTGIGETKTQPSGSMSVSPAMKAVRAWNEMSQWIYELYDFMQSSFATYPEYDSNSMTYALFYYFKKINPLF
jgi:hypothetical protein